MPTKKTKVSRTAPKKSGGFQFRWWMGLLLIGIVALAGVVIIRFSFAGSLPEWSFGAQEQSVDYTQWVDRVYQRKNNDGAYLDEVLWNQLTKTRSNYPVLSGCVSDATRCPELVQTNGSFVAPAPSLDAAPNIGAWEAKVGPTDATNKIYSFGTNVTNINDTAKVAENKIAVVACFSVRLTSADSLGGVNATTKLYSKTATGERVFAQVTNHYMPVSKYSVTIPNGPVLQQIYGGIPDAPTYQPYCIATYLTKDLPSGLEAKIELTKAEGVTQEINADIWNISITYTSDVNTWFGSFKNYLIANSYGWPIAPDQFSYVTQCYNENGLKHPGVDLGNGNRNNVTDLLAISNGTVEYAGQNASGYGNQVILRFADGKYWARYAHMASLAVTTGQVVSKGQVLGKMGSTGASGGVHLHLETTTSSPDPNIFSGSTGGPQGVAQYAASVNPLSVLPQDSRYYTYNCSRDKAGGGKSDKSKYTGQLP
jgi:murein DD-endopeptidase MepM/ murein hydrolase activator NlpD